MKKGILRLLQTQSWESGIVICCLFLAVLVAAHGLSLVEVSGGESCFGVWALRWGGVFHSGLEVHGLSSCGPWALIAGSAAVMHKLSCLATCGIFQDQGSNMCPLHWQVVPSPVDHQGRSRVKLCSRNYPIWSSIQSASWYSGNSVNRGSNPGLLHCRQILYQRSSQMRKPESFLGHYSMMITSPWTCYLNHLSLGVLIHYIEMTVSTMFISQENWQDEDEPLLDKLLLLLLSHFSRVWLCVTPQTAAHQAPLSLGFSRQEHWSGLPFPSPMHESEKWKWSRSVVSNS